MIVARHGDQNLEAIIRDIKKYTSAKLIQAIRDNEQEREGKSITRIDQSPRDDASLIENLKIELRMGLNKKK